MKWRFIDAFLIPDSLSERNLDAKRLYLLLFPKKAMFLVLGIVARCAVAVGAAFIVGKSVPSIPNKVYRFIFLFVLWVPVNFVFNYVDIQLLGYHKMGWTAVSVIALIFAIFGTFFPPQPHSSD